MDAAKPIGILALLLLLSGCAVTKGTMFDGRVCTFATNAGVQQEIKTITDVAVPGQYQAQAQMAEQLAKLSATALCEAARAAEAQQAAKQ